MEANNNNADYKNKVPPQYSSENASSRPGPSSSRQYSPENASSRPGPSSSRQYSSENASSRPGPSSSRQYSSDNASSRPGPSSSRQWHENTRDRKIPLKRERSPNNEWNRERASKSRETSREQEIRENGDQISAVAASQPLQQQMLPPQQALCTAPYPTYSYATPENFQMEHNQGNYAMMAPYNMMPMNSQWPLSNGMAMPSNNASMNPTTPCLAVPNGMDMVPNAGTNMGTYPYIGDPSMYGMLPPMGNYYPYPIMNAAEAVPAYSLEPITLSSAVLTPPLPGEPPRSRRDKPRGCKTVFVGSLPSKITEDIIREAFSRCGEIATIRMSKKNFCHIRFKEMQSVDEALLYSGFRLKIENQDDEAYNGKLHVDYAVARDDQFDYECNERQRRREERHRQMMEQQAFHPPSPPPIVHYSELEASAVAENLRNEETFRSALQVLITWLERGECGRKNTGTFFSMIQSSNSQVRKLMNDKGRCEDELRKAKDNLNKKNAAVELELGIIEKVYFAAEMQKNWDHFSKSQRKNIEGWKNQTKEFKESVSREMLYERVEEEMEMSDNEDNDFESSVRTSHSENIVEELNTLREKVDTRDHQLTVANQELEELKANCEKHVKEVLSLKIALEESKKHENTVNGETSTGENSNFNNSNQKVISTKAVQCSPIKVDPNENETRLISLVAIFLHVHPFGASIDYICSYLVKIDSTVSARDVESLLTRFPAVFKEEVTGIGATLEKKWTFVGFKP